MEAIILAYRKAEGKNPNTRICIEVLLVIVGILLPVITEESFLWVITGVCWLGGICAIPHKLY